MADWPDVALGVGSVIAVRGAMKDKLYGGGQGLVVWAWWR